MKVCEGEKGRWQHREITFDDRRNDACPMCEVMEKHAGEIADLKDTIEIFKKLNADLRED